MRVLLTLLMSSCLLSEAQPARTVLGLSPDEKTLYVSNSDPQHRLWMRYDVAKDGKLANGTLLMDASAEKGAGNPDGLKLDLQGNIYGAGPGGVWGFSAARKHLGTIKMPEIPTTCAWATTASRSTLPRAPASIAFSYPLGARGLVSSVSKREDRK